MKTKRVLTLLLALALCLGLLPMAAMAEEDGGASYSITFDANGGKFENGSDKQSISTHPEGVIMYAPDTPTRAGYTFVDWGGMSDDELKYHVFTADATVTATWAKELEMVITFDPNGGTCGVKTLPLVDWTLTEPLPVPTRPGYTFEGWYNGYRSPDNPGYKIGEGESFTAPPTVTAVWTKDGPAEEEPGQNYVGEIWFHLEGGAVVSVGGVKPNGYEDVVLPSGDLFRQAPDEGDEILGMMMSGSGNGKLSALPVLEKEGYTFDGWYTMQTGGNEVTTSTTFAPSGKYGRAYVWARWTENKASEAPSNPSNPNGPFTVKFDLNCTNPKLSELPKERTVQKGSAVALPDGTKLTPPSDEYVFYAWCEIDSEGKLFPWDESHAVTGDMTLYAGWIRKGTTTGGAAPAGSKPVESTAKTPEETAKPAESTSPAAPAFTDVAATSPFAPAISWAVEKSITNGTTPTTFSPGSTCTRGHILTFLWRSQGSPEPTIANPYKDEIPGAFQKAAVWAHEKGLVSGDTFGSAVPCTRSSSVTYMWKLAGSPDAKAASFKDVTASSDSAKAINWAVEQGVTNGTGDGTTFSPESTCTRGQIVTFLYRAYEK